MISFRTHVDKSNKQTDQFIHLMAGWMNWLKKQTNKESTPKNPHAKQFVARKTIQKTKGTLKQLVFIDKFCWDPWPMLLCMGVLVCLNSIFSHKSMAKLIQSDKINVWLLHMWWRWQEPVHMNSWMHYVPYCKPSCSFVYSSRTVGVGYVHRRLSNTMSTAQSRRVPEVAKLWWLVLKISKGLLTILWYRWTFQVKGSWLWAAYFSLESQSVTKAVKISKSRYNSQTKPKLKI